jgi:diguanylate cyclase (GGDEF)-like protein
MTATPIRRRWSRSSGAPRYGGTWLCPRDLDRARLLEMQSRIKRALPVVYGTLAITFVVLSSAVGWWPLLALAITYVHHRFVGRPMERSARPEYWMMYLFVVSQALAGVAIALTGGATSPVLPWLVIAASTLPLRFTARGVALGLIVSVAVVVAASEAAAPARLLGHPEAPLITVAVLICVMAFVATLMRAELEHRSESILDPLTGLLNRRTLMTRLEELRVQAQRLQQPICLIACDVDEFKTINDVHGHDRGDVVIQETADLIQSQLRSFELVYRTGGDEFLIILPGMDLADGLGVGERLRDVVHRVRPGGLDVTLSIGVSALHPPETDSRGLLGQSDAALYEAKSAGRNRVCAWVAREGTGTSSSAINRAA